MHRPRLIRPRFGHLPPKADVEPAPTMPHVDTAHGRHCACAQCRRAGVPQPPALRSSEQTDRDK